MKRIISLVMAVLMLTAAFAGCGKATDSTQSTVSSQTTPQATPQATQTAAPTTAKAAAQYLQVAGFWTGERFEAIWANQAGFARIALFDRLLVLDEKGGIKGPQLAESYTASPDGLTYTFVLRKNIKWHDGVAFSVDDIVWSFKASLLSSSINSITSNAFLKVKGSAEFKAGTSKEVSGISTKDNTITFSLSEPSSTFLATMANWAPLPKHLLEKEDPAKMHICSFWDKPIGTGAYKFTEVKPNEYAIIEPFADYYGAKPSIPKVKLDLRTGTQMEAMVAKGEIDHFYTNDPALVKSMTKYPDYKRTDADTLYIRYLMVNTNGRPNANIKDKDMPFANLKARDALRYAIDYATITKQFFGDIGDQLVTKVPTSSPFFNKDAKKFEFSTQKAKQLLTEANFDFSKTIILAYFYKDQTTIDMIDTIKYYLEQAGMKVQTKLLEGDLLELIYKSRDYDLCYAGLGATVPEEIYSFFTSSSMGTMIHGTDTKWDTLYESLTKSRTDAERITAMKALQVYEQETTLQLPMFTLRSVYYTNSKNVELPANFKFGEDRINFDRILSGWKLK